MPLRFLTGLLAIELGGLCAAFEPCGLLAMSALPEGTAFTSWMAVAGFDALTTARIEAMLEQSFVQSTAEDASLARAAAGLWRTCFPNSFTGDTPVLLDGGDLKPIKDVQVGDLVVVLFERPGLQRGCEADDDVVVGEVSVQQQELDHPVPAAAGPNDSVSR
jgi:hypothetical protein